MRSTKVLAAFIFALTAVGLSGCSGGGGGRGAGSGGSQPSSTFLTRIDRSRTSVVPGQPVQLAAATIGVVGAGTTWTWTIGEDAILVGQTVEATFADPGVFPVAVEARAPDGSTSYATSAITVLDPAGTPTPQFGLAVSARPGDVDGDDDLDLRDLLVISKFAARMASPGDPASTEGADADRNGVIDERDLDYVAQAVVEDSTVPLRMTPERPFPGSFVRISASALLDPMADIRIRMMESGRVLELDRDGLGSGVFIVPFDSSVGTATFEILLDGVATTSISSAIDPLPMLSIPLGTGVRTLIQRALTRLPAIVAKHDAYASIVGMNEESKAVVHAMAAQFVEDFDPKLRMLDDALANMDAGVLETIDRILLANGLDSGLASLDKVSPGVPSTMLVSPAIFGTPDLETIACEVHAVTQAMTKTLELTTYVCDYAIIIAAVISLETGGVAAIPALASAAATCAANGTGLLVLGVLNTFAAEASNLQMAIKATPTLLTPETTTQAEVRVYLRASLTGAIGQAAATTASNYLLQEGVKRALNWGPLSVVTRVLSRLSKEEADRTLDAISSQVAAAIGATLDATGLTGRLNDAIRSYADFFGIDREIDASAVSFDITPQYGSITLPSAPMLPAIYQCDMTGTAPPSQIRIRAERSVCGRLIQGSTSVTCGGRNVTVVMGDNGNLLDDIFLVRVDGETVLTSNEPVLVASATVTLANGPHTVEMVGLAAPDGVGTYYIAFNGATIESGDPNVGTDLTPGVVKTFHIQVN